MLSKPVNQNSGFRNKREKCFYFDTGYCKYGLECFKNHPDKVCLNPSCPNESCDLRHPNPCKYGQRCRFNNKKICCYSHLTFESVDKNKLSKLEENVNKLTNQINKNKEENQKKIKDLEDFYKSEMSKMKEQFEKQTTHIEQELIGKDAEIKALKKVIETNRQRIDKVNNLSKFETVKNELKKLKKKRLKNAAWFWQQILMIMCWGVIRLKWK